MKLLNDFSAIKLSGDKAADFLQGQLTCDIKQLVEGQPQLAGYCTYQGRVLATLWVLQDKASYYLILPDDLAENIQQILHKYAVFSKVEVVLLPKDFAVLVDYHNGLQLEVREEAGQEQEQAFTAWLVEAEIPILHQQTSEQFTPHMLNLPQLGAVSFAKGCYVGQEIVARTEYKGKVKRHLQKVVMAEKVNLVRGQTGEDLVGEVIDFYHPLGGGTVYLAVTHPS